MVTGNLPDSCRNSIYHSPGDDVTIFRQTGFDTISDWLKSVFGSFELGKFFCDVFFYNLIENFEFIFEKKLKIH